MISQQPSPKSLDYIHSCVGMFPGEAAIGACQNIDTALPLAPHYLIQRQQTRMAEQSAKPAIVTYVKWMLDKRR